MASQPLERWDPHSPSTVGPAPASASALGAIVQQCPGCAGTGRTRSSKAPGTEHS